MLELEWERTRKLAGQVSEGNAGLAYPGVADHHDFENGVLRHQRNLKFARFTKRYRKCRCEYLVTKAVSKRRSECFSVILS